MNLNDCKNKGKREKVKIIEYSPIWIIDHFLHFGVVCRDNEGNHKHRQEELNIGDQAEHLIPERLFWKNHTDSSEQGEWGCHWYII
jgi:hypothetical protein